MLLVAKESIVFICARVVANGVLRQTQRVSAAAAAAVCRRKQIGPPRCRWLFCVCLRVIRTRTTRRQRYRNTHKTRCKQHTSKETGSTTKKSPSCRVQKCHAPVNTARHTRFVIRKRHEGSTQKGAVYFASSLSSSSALLMILAAPNVRRIAGCAQSSCWFGVPYYYCVRKAQWKPVCRSFFVSVYIVTRERRIQRGVCICLPVCRVCFVCTCCCASVCTQCCANLVHSS